MVKLQALKDSGHGKSFLKKKLTINYKLEEEKNIIKAVQAEEK